MQNIIGIVDTLEFQIENNNADDNVVITYESCEVVETKIDEPKNQKNLSLQLEKKLLKKKVEKQIIS